MKFQREGRERERAPEGLEWSDVIQENSAGDRIHCTHPTECSTFSATKGGHAGVLGNELDNSQVYFLNHYRWGGRETFNGFYTTTV